MNMNKSEKNQFVSQLKELIKENERLSDNLERLELFLKLAIAVTGSLPFRKVENVYSKKHLKFIDNEHIQIIPCQEGFALHKMERTEYGIMPLSKPMTLEEINEYFEDKHE